MIDSNHLPLSTTQAASETFIGYQTLMGLPPDDFANMVTVEKEAEARYAVWKVLLDLQDKVDDWTAGNLLSQQDNSVRILAV